jgi:thiol-disulfide isomerase/thioredoxin
MSLSFRLLIALVLVAFSFSPLAAAGAQEKASDDTKAEKKELSREELLKKIADTQERGMELSARKKEAAAYKEYQAAGELALELKKRFGKLTEEEQETAATALYNGACGLAMTGSAKEAFAFLKEAFDSDLSDSGLSDGDLLDQDKDLVSVRELPEFAVWRKDLDKTLTARAQEKVAKELAEFKTYPFDFVLPDLDGKSTRLADFKGKVVIVDIWGTWCPPCRAEIPSFVKLQSTYGEKGFAVVGLNYEHGEGDKVVQGIKDFMTENKMNYTCLIGDTDTRKQVPDFQGFPTTLFIDRTGKVRLQFVGLHSYSILEAVVTKLLDEPKP